jgi:hypothetical protein
VKNKTIPETQKPNADSCADLLRRLRLAPEDAGGPSRVEMLRERAEAAQVLQRLCEWRKLTNSGLRLRCGELTAAEIRTVRAVLAAIGHASSGES